MEEIEEYVIELEEAIRVLEDQNENKEKLLLEQQKQIETLEKQMTNNKQYYENLLKDINFQSQEEISELINEIDSLHQSHMKLEKKNEILIETLNQVNSQLLDAKNVIREMETKANEAEETSLSHDLSSSMIVLDNFDLKPKENVSSDLNIERQKELNNNYNNYNNINNKEESKKSTPTSQTRRISFTNEIEEDFEEELPSPITVKINRNLTKKVSRQPNQFPAFNNNPNNNNNNNNTNGSHSSNKYEEINASSDWKNQKKVLNVFADHEGNDSSRIGKTKERTYFHWED